MAQLRHSDAAWIALATGVITYDLLAKDGEQMTDAAHRYSTCHPWITRLVIATTVGHLTSLIPPRLDIFHLTGTIRRRARATH